MLTINEIFYSVQGESSYAGQPCVFVRLTACDLRCSWCDTPYAFHEGRRRPLEDVLAEVDGFGCDLVEVTGGEPLLQAEVYPLMEALVARGNRVLLADPAFGNRTMLAAKFERAWLDYPEFGKVGFVVVRADEPAPPNRLAPRPTDFVSLR